MSKATLLELRDWLARNPHVTVERVASTDLKSNLAPQHLMKLGRRYELDYRNNSKVVAIRPVDGGAHPFMRLELGDEYETWWTLEEEDEGLAVRAIRLAPGGRFQVEYLFQSDLLIL